MQPQLKRLTFNLFSLFFPPFYFWEKKTSKYWCGWQTESRRQDPDDIFKRFSLKASIHLIAECNYLCVNCLPKNLQLLFSICVKASVKNVLWERKMKVSKLFKSTNMLFSICWQHKQFNIFLPELFRFWIHHLYQEKSLAIWEKKKKHFYFEIGKYFSYFTFSCPPGCKKMVLYIHESVPNIFGPIWLPQRRESLISFEHISKSLKCHYFLS